MKKLLFFTLSALLCAGFTSCSDDNPESDTPPVVNPTPDPDPDPEPTPEPEDGYTLYATGYSDVVQDAFWWKAGDSSLTVLGNSNESISTEAIVVADDGTVYVGGAMTSDAMGGYEAATVWKNGVAQLLTKMDRPTDASVYGLAVDGNDIWAAGFFRYTRDEGWSFRRDAAILWKNGNMIELTQGETYAKAWDVTVSGNYVYAAGEVSNADGYAVATVWKGSKDATDGSTYEVTSLSDGRSHAYAEAICVDGSDVYATGYKSLNGDSKVAVLWKNGVETVLTNNESYAVSVCVDGSDVYVAGWEYVDINGRSCAVATLWVNGVAEHLYNQPHTSQARCVSVKGGKVYASGFIGDQAVIWIDGVAGAVTNGAYPACVTSIFLKKD